MVIKRNKKWFEKVEFYGSSPCYTTNDFDFDF